MPVFVFWKTSRFFSFTDDVAKKRGIQRLISLGAGRMTEDVIVNKLMQSIGFPNYYDGRLSDLFLQFNAAELYHLYCNSKVEG